MKTKPFNEFISTLVKYIAEIILFLAKKDSKRCMVFRSYWNPKMYFYVYKPSKKETIYYKNSLQHHLFNFFLNP